MKLTRLKITGFKSFVEPTEVLIEPGLTGVVGPNGCGKSNLVEALRWVMGENSHKSMRATGMDDVIFAGSGARPARNTADVTLVIDNADRRAPAAFNDKELLEVSRHIEREEGSTYRINGREVRARDVQLLFADAATGARSPALVRQGQIGEIIAAKPQARRRILEDAAGQHATRTSRPRSGGWKPNSCSSDTATPATRRPKPSAHWRPTSAWSPTARRSRRKRPASRRWRLRRCRRCATARRTRRRACNASTRR
jgi:chromosome segregation ATPase